MGKVYFLLGVHNHQPIGNFPHIFEEAYQRCYLPFVSLLEKFPRLKFNLHNSGCLYDWILKNKKEYLKIVKKLLKRKQIEIISGGYYEPILPLIPDEDKEGQIKFMNKFIEREFNCKPEGMWVAERVWEPYLARVIHNSNLRYTFLDDTHFRYAGFREREFFGYYTTEDEGKSIYVFPISKTLRYKIPFSLPEEAIAILGSFAQKEDILVTLFDDGEKFGLWPHTYEWVYKKKWLEEFLSLLDKSSSIETITASEAIKKFSSKGIIYLPTTSYEEMNEWVLEPESHIVYDNLKKFLKDNNKWEEFRDFIRGGIFRNFYYKYSRLNYLHKRMLLLSRKINVRTNFKKDKSIFINLWKSQINCGYWHGIFGGFYLGHIRGAIYEHLLYAENSFDRKYSRGDITLEKVDIDMDGKEEVFLKNKHLICCFSSYGGALLELSLRSEAINLLNTITRKRESYHKRIRENIENESKISTIHSIITQKEKNLEAFLIYDKYPRLGLIDHLLSKDLSLDDFNLQRGITSLSNNSYKYSMKKKKSKIVLDYCYKDMKLSFLKRIEFSSLCGLDVLYNFREKNFWESFNFGIEFNLSFPSLKDIFKKEKRGDIPLAKEKVWKDISCFKIVDSYKKIIFTFEFNEATVFSLPLYSVSSSESGFEKVYQQLSVLFIFGNKDTFHLSLRIKKIVSI
jgi:alpha-amylase